MGETAKARARRERDGWFDAYIDESRPGFDLGCQRDPLNATFRRWDRIYGDGDASELAGVPDGIAGTIYSSHLLEHVEDPVAAIRRWWDVLGPGGRLIVIVPHRDLYEGRERLPSRWNGDHKAFYLPDRAEEPDTRSLRATIEEALKGKDYEVEVDCVVRDEGWAREHENKHAVGEYSIEAIVRKPGPAVGFFYSESVVDSQDGGVEIVGKVEGAIGREVLESSPPEGAALGDPPAEISLGVDLGIPGEDRTVASVVDPPAGKPGGTGESLDVPVKSDAGNSGRPEKKNRQGRPGAGR